MKRMKKETSSSDDERHSCNGSVIDVESESELLAKGEDFLRSHAVKHCIFNSFCLDPKVLVKELSCHYQKSHQKEMNQDVTAIQNSTTSPVTAATGNCDGSTRDVPVEMKSNFSLL